MPDVVQAAFGSAPGLIPEEWLATAAAGRTVNGELATLSALCSFAVGQGYLKTNPVFGVKKEKVEKEKSGLFRKLEIARELLTILAILAAGFWALFLAEQESVFVPRITMEQRTEYRRLPQGDVLVRVHLEMNNPGLKRIEVGRCVVMVNGLIPGKGVVIPQGCPRAQACRDARRAAGMRW